MEIGWREFEIARVRHQSVSFSVRFGILGVNCPLSYLDCGSDVYLRKINILDFTVPREQQIYFEIGRVGFQAILAAWILVLGIGNANGQKPTELHLVQDQNGVTVLDGIRPVLTYQRSVKSKDGKWSRSNYVHPLYDLDGEVLTEDFPSDHGHHRGVFWAWHQVIVDGQAIGDAWLCENFQWDVIELESVVDQDTAVIQATTQWKSPQLQNSEGRMIPIAREQAKIVVHKQADNLRIIDFEIAVTAMLENVKIGGSDDEKGYGGFSPRFKLSEQMQFRGQHGLVEPTLLQLKAGPWIDVADERGGVAMLCDGSNPGYPQPWILRRERSMQNAAYPGREPMALSTSEPLVLRYRLVIHRGEVSADTLNGLLLNSK